MQEEKGHVPAHIGRTSDLLAGYGFITFAILFGSFARQTT
jgi:hypothetical protein